MSECTHDSTIVEYDGGNIQIERCTWTCGQTLVSIRKTNGVTVTMTYAELSALRARVAELEKDLASVLINGFFGGGGAYMSVSEADEIASRHWETWQEVEKASKGNA